MANFFRRVTRHLKEGFWGVIRHGSMSISSISAVTITLLIIGVFLIFSINVDNITKDIEESVAIVAIVSFDYEEQDELDRIKASSKAVSGVKDVIFSSKDEEWEYYQNLYETEETAAIFGPFEDENPMHHVFQVEVVSGNEIENVATGIEAIEGIDSVEYGGASAVMLVSALDSIRYGGFILVIAVSALAIFLIANTIKLTIYARHKEIGIMRNVGATNGYIRAPFVIEGMIIGFIGSIIPVALCVFGYIYVYDLLGGVFLTEMFVMIPPHPFVLLLVAILSGTGMLVGLVVSFCSVTKYLRWKR